jgi:hypothetical protein
MYTLKHIRMIDNYAELVKAGLSKLHARLITRKMATRVILEVAVSDVGVHVEFYDTSVHAEKTCVFRFVA